MSRKSVLLADDHTLVRAGIRALVEKLTDVEVIAEAKDGREALRLVREHKPDLVLMDIAMPDLSGFEATRRVHEADPSVKVLMLTMHDEEELVGEAVIERDEFASPEEAAVTERDRPPGATDHADPHPN